MNQLSKKKVALLAAVTERLTGRGSAWMGLHDEFDNELNTPGYSRHKLRINWEEETNYNVPFGDIGPCRVARVALYDREFGGEPKAKMRLSANSISVAAGTTLHVAATFPTKHSV